MHFFASFTFLVMECCKTPKKMNTEQIRKRKIEQRWTKIIKRLFLYDPKRRLKEQRKWFWLMSRMRRCLYCPTAVPNAVFQFPCACYAKVNSVSAFIKSVKISSNFNELQDDLRFAWQVQGNWHTGLGTALDRTGKTRWF